MSNKLLSSALFSHLYSELWVYPPFRDGPTTERASPTFAVFHQTPSYTIVRRMANSTRCAECNYVFFHYIFSIYRTVS